MQQQKPNDADPMVVMGYVAGAQGLRGWVKLKTFTECVENLTEFPMWWLGNEKNPWREISVENFSVQSKGLVAKFADCNDRNRAEEYRGLQVAVPRSMLPQTEEDEYYWADLIGLEVINLAEETLGTVESLMDTGANDVLCVRGSSGEVLIPYLKSVIQQVSLAEKIIRVDWQADWAD